MTTQKRADPVVGMGPHKIPRPCMVCGKAFELEGYWNQVRHRKTCSEECNRNTRVRDEIKCRVCSVPKPRSAFAQPEGARQRRSTCMDCWQARSNRKRVRTNKQCCKCEQVRPLADFDMYNRPGRPDKYHRPYCRECGARERIVGTGPHKIPHPCVVCGKEFEVKGFWSHVRYRKTCSDECFKAPRRKLGQSCSRCKRDLPRDAFDNRARCGTLNRVCRKCVIERDRDRHMLLRSRPTAFQMWRTAKQRAEREGYEFRLTQGGARTLYKSKCCLCGRAPSSIRPAEPGPLSPANVRCYCRRCSRLLHVFDHQELFLLAHEIAAHTPLVPKERANA